MTQKGVFAEAKVTSKGQVTLPVRVKERLGIAEGDYLLFLEEGGRLFLQAGRLVPKPRGGAPAR